MVTVNGYPKILMMDKIIMLQTAGRYSEIVLDDRPILADENLSTICRDLPKHFIQVDRCRYINSKCIRTLRPIGNHRYEARLSDSADTVVTISRRYSAGVKNALGL
jgi:DNA-binding LytR/AlgR family response regulator